MAEALRVFATDSCDQSRAMPLLAAPDRRAARRNAIDEVYAQIKT